MAGSDFKRRLVPLGALLLRALLPALGRSWRLTVVGEQRLAAIVASKTPHVLAFWHDRSPPVGYLLYRLHRRGLPITLLASQSRDGQLITKLGEAWGFDIVRGSASRGGRDAVRALYRGITRRGSSPICSPDGPRGPAHHFKIGIVTLAQLSGAPVLPFSWAADRVWTLGSWDRMQIPKPFARVALVVGEPQPVPRRLDADGLEAERLRLETLLDDLRDEADQRLAGP